MSGPCLHHRGPHRFGPHDSNVHSPQAALSLEGTPFGETPGIVVQWQAYSHQAAILAVIGPVRLLFSSAIKAALRWFILVL